MKQGRNVATAANPWSLLEGSKWQVGSGHELGLWRMTLYLFPLFSKVWKHKAQAAAGSDYVLRYP